MTAARKWCIVRRGWGRDAVFFNGLCRERITSPPGSSKFNNDLFVYPSIEIRELSCDQCNQHQLLLEDSSCLIILASNTGP